MTATLLAPRFSTLKTYYPQGGKSEPGKPLLTPADIDDRVRDVTSGGRWTQSPQAIAAYELYNAIAAISMQNAAATGRPAVTRDRIDDLIAASQVRGLGTCPELDTLFADGLLARDGQGGVLVTGPPARQKGPRAYLGWHRGSWKGLPYMQAPALGKLILWLHAELIERGLAAIPAKFPADVTDQFNRARQRGEICLPWWAWEVIVNLSLPDGKHPVSGRTVANRHADLAESGLILLTRVPRTRLTGGTWVTTSACYALPKPGLTGIVTRFRVRVRRILTPGKPQPTQAWREMAERWRFRDLEAGWGA